MATQSISTASEPKQPGKTGLGICFQCRNRKVRCDGTPGGCENCIRLKFECSFAAPAFERGQGDPENEQDSRHESAFFERKRARRACLRCHTQKAKCSGESPQCLRCRQKGFVCQYNKRSGVALRNATRQRQSESVARESIESESVERTETPSGDVPTAREDKVTVNAPNVAKLGNDVARNVSPGAELGLENIILRQHIDAFFDNIYPITGYSFIHRAIFIQNWSKGVHSANLLRAICGASARYLSSDVGHLQQAGIWTDQSEEQVLKRIADISLADVETLLVLIFDRLAMRKFGNAMALSALVTRFAYAMRLNHLDKKLTFIAQERRRRLMWSIFIMDSFLSNGRPEFTLVAVDSIHQQLPCNERSFAFDIPVETEPLRPLGGPSNHSNPGTMGYIVRILDIRLRIQKYMNIILKHKCISRQSHAELEVLEQDIQHFGHSLPATYMFNERNLSLRAFTPQRTSFVMLNIWWHICYCDLYRFAIPGFREALPNDILESLPATFLRYCRERCLEHAVKISDIFRSIQKVGKDIFITDTGLAVCSLQSARIITTLGPIVTARLEKSEILAKVKACSDILLKQSQVYPTPKVMRDMILELFHATERISSGTDAQGDRDKNPQEYVTSPDSAIGLTLPLTAEQVHEKLCFLEEIRQMKFGYRDEDDAPISNNEQNAQPAHRPVEIVEQNMPNLESEPIPGSSLASYSHVQAPTTIMDSGLESMDYDMPWMLSPETLMGIEQYDVLLDPFLHFQCDQILGFNGRQWNQDIGPARDPQDSFYV